MVLKHKSQLDLTEGSVVKDMVLFIIPLLIGQLLQQMYNLADAWVIGNFAGNTSFAAVSSGGSISFFIVGFFNGMAIGGGVVVSRFFGARDEEHVRAAIHNNILFGVIASVFATALALWMTPYMLRWMNTPDDVMPYSLSYFRIYFGGVSTMIMYNILMSVMRAVGDSVHPLYYLLISSLVNVLLDLLFVAVFHWDVAGAALATILAQGLSTVLCLFRMLRQPREDLLHLSLRRLKLHPSIMKDILVQGIPTGVQNSVISIGNIVIQTNINAFGAYAMSGHGAYARIEGFVFLPIMCLSMALPTFVSQNLGARKYERARKGARFGIVTGMLTAELIGVLLIVFSRQAISLFTNEPQAIDFGLISIRTIPPFYLILAFSHCSAGVMRGCGKALIPMITMLVFWCGVRILYVTTAIRFFPCFNTIAWAYPLTWSCSTIVFSLFFLRTDWTHAYEHT